METEPIEDEANSAPAIVRPDFECEGCGHEVFGSRPGRCIKCGGMAFRARYVPQQSGILRVAESLKRMHAELGELLAFTASSRHRRRRNVLKQLGVLRGASARALKIIIDTPEPTRGKRSLKSETPGKDLQGVEPPSTVV